MQPIRGAVPGPSGAHVIAASAAVVVCYQFVVDGRPAAYRVVVDPHVFEAGLLPVPATSTDGLGVRGSRGQDGDSCQGHDECKYLAHAATFIELRSWGKP